MSRTLPDHYGSRSYVALRIPLVVGFVLFIRLVSAVLSAASGHTKTPPHKHPHKKHHYTTTKTPPHKPSLNPGQTRSKSRSCGDPYYSLRIPNLQTLTDSVGASFLSATLCRPSAPCPLYTSCVGCLVCRLFGPAVGRLVSALLSAPCLLHLVSVVFSGLLLFRPSFLSAVSQKPASEGLRKSSSEGVSIVRSTYNMYIAS